MTTPEKLMAELIKAQQEMAEAADGLRAHSPDELQAAMDGLDELDDEDDDDYFADEPEDLLIETLQEELDELRRENLELKRRLGDV